MATVAIGLDLGTRIARWGQIELLQQPQYRSDAARNHAMRLSIAVATMLTALFIVSAEPLGRYYVSPELPNMIYLSAPVFLLSASSATAEAILRNDFRFKQLAYRNTISTLIGGSVAILLAIRGYGALALAAQQLVQAIVVSIWSWAVVSWRPRIVHSLPLVPDQTAQGATVMAGLLLPQLVPRTFDLFVGLSLGPVALGIMRVAYRFNDFVGQLVWVPLVGVASAQLSSTTDNLREMRLSYLKLTQVSAIITCPLLVGVGLVAPEAVPVLFGANWEASIPLVQISALLAFVMPVNYYFASAMVALGQRRVIIRQALVDVALAVILATAAAHVSLLAVASAMVLRAALTSVMNTLDLSHHLRVRFIDLATTLAPPFAATIVMAAGVTLVRELLSPVSPIPTLAILTLSGMAAYVGILWLGARFSLWPDFGAAIRRFTPQSSPSISRS